MSIFKKLEAIEKENIYLNSIIENLPQLVYWKDKNRIYQGCNKYAAELLNLKSPADIIGKSDNDFAWSAQRIQSLQKVDELIIEKGISSVVEDAIPVNGDIKIYLTSKTPLRNKEGEIIGILGISTDIADRKRMEIDLRVAKDKAEVASQAKTEFIANMGHDIRTPLAGIIGMAHILKNEVASSRAKEHAKIIYESGDQLLELLNGILDLISADSLIEESLPLEVFDLHDVIQDVIELEYAAVISRCLVFNKNIDESIPQYLLGDKMKLHRILLNLVSNSIKFTEKGSVALNVRLHSRDGDEVKIEFSVQDTGIGIAQELQDKVFDRFYKISPSYKGIYSGNGIGLNIVQKYVSLLGGELQLSSQIGVGTTFSFVIPLKIDQVSNMKKPSPLPSKVLLAKTPSKTYSNQPVKFNQLRILLVEDNIPVLTIMKIMLEEYEAQVMTALDAESAYQFVLSSDFDLVITDLGLPGKSGDELTSMIRAFEQEQHRQPMMIVGLTGHALGQITQRCLDAGMNEVYRKPMQSQALKALLESLLLPIDEGNEDIAGVLGEDLPDTEQQLFEIDKYPLLDLQVAIQTLGNESVARMILKTLKKDGVTDDLVLIKEAYVRSDWVTIEKLSHKIKGGACYGTVRMYYALLYMERYIKAGHTRCLKPLYDQMIRVIDESMRCLDGWLENG